MSLQLGMNPATAAGLRPAAASLAAAATVVLTLVLPVAMVPANRSSPLMLAIAALLAAVSALQDPGATSFATRIGRLLRTPEAALGALFAIWALASVSWSVDPRLSLVSLGELAVPVLSALVIAACMPDRIPPWATKALAGGVALTCLLVLVEMQFDFPLRRLWGGRVEPYVMNRAAVTALAMSWPLVAALRLQGRGRLAILLVLALGLAVAMAWSGSAKLALALGLVVSFAALRWPAAVRALGIVLIFATLAVQPVFGHLVDSVIPASAMHALRHASARERIDIWISFGEAARARLAHGTGFGSTARLHQDPVAAEVRPERREMLAVGHPHNAFLQLWVELGLVGVTIAAALFVCLSRRMMAMPLPLLPERLAFFAGVSSIAVESHGAWQGWWIAAIAVGILLFRMLAPAPGTAGSGT